MQHLGFSVLIEQQDSHTGCLSIAIQTQRLVEVLVSTRVESFNFFVSKHIVTGSDLDL
jgi:hypothetical protein